LFGAQQVLDEVAARAEVDAVAGVDELLPDGAEQVGLAAPGLAEGEEVFLAPDEAAVEEAADLGGGFGPEALEFQGAEALLPGDARFVEEALDALMPPLLAFGLAQ